MKCISLLFRNCLYISCSILSVVYTCITISICRNVSITKSELVVKNTIVFDGYAVVAYDVPEDGLSGAMVANGQMRVAYYHTVYDFYQWILDHVSGKPAVAFVTGGVHDSASIVLTTSNSFKWTLLSQPMDAFSYITTRSNASYEIISNPLVASQVALPSVTATLSPAVTQPLSVKYCMPFTASNGKTVTCSIYACGDTTLYISSCYGNTTCVGDTNLRLAEEFNKNKIVASNDDSCGSCSVIAYSIPKGTRCQLYNLRQGCYSFSTCGGTVQVKGAKRVYTLGQSPTLAPVSQGQYMCAPTSGRVNTICYNNETYSTLGDVSLTGSSSTCQSGYISLPTNWELAPDTLIARDLIASYPWSTSTVFLASQVGISTTLNQPAGRIVYTPYRYYESISSSNNMYSTPNSYYCGQILIKWMEKDETRMPTSAPTATPNPKGLYWNAAGSLKYLNGYFKGGFSFTNSDSPPIINSVYYGTYMKHGTKYQW